MLNVDVYVWLILISLALSIFTIFISRGKDNNYTELIAIPVLSLIGFLFGDEDNFSIRIQVSAILLIAYVFFYFLLHGISYAISKLKGASRTAAPVGSHPTNPISITLPLDSPHIIDNRFVEDIPANVDSLIHMSEKMQLVTKTFIQRFCSCSDDDARGVELRAYFLALCYHIASLFDNSTRVHVRILKSGGYQKYVATCEGAAGQEYKNNMKVMSLDNKMIHESFVHRCSLIKILNLPLHEEGSNHKWKNYLMFSLPQVTHENKPVFSIGISVTRKRNDLFYFLNYCEIESIIGHHIENILNDENCHLIEFVERFYFSSS